IRPIPAPRPSRAPTSPAHAGPTITADAPSTYSASPTASTSRRPTRSAIRPATPSIAAAATRFTTPAHAMSARESATPSASRSTIGAASIPATQSPMTTPPATPTKTPSPTFFAVFLLRWSFGWAVAVALSVLAVLLLLWFSACAACVGAPAVLRGPVLLAVAPVARSPGRALFAVLLRRGLLDCVVCADERRFRARRLLDGVDPEAVSSDVGGSPVVSPRGVSRSHAVSGAGMGQRG